MAEERKIILTVETVNAAKSVAELQKILKSAKDELIATKEGSKEYQNALTVAAAASDKLALANKAVKDSTPTTTIKELKRELLEAKSAMLAAKEGSEEYNAALARASEASDKLKRASESIKIMEGSAVGSAFTAASKGLGELVNGFGALTASMQIFGVENEGVLEGMQKLQQLTAIANGLKGLPEMGKHFRLMGVAIKQAASGTWLATAAQKAYNLAMSMSPIGLIITGVVALIGALAGLWALLGKSNDEQERQNRLMDEFREKQAKIRDDAEFEIRLNKAKGASERELYEQKKQMINAEIERNKVEIERVMSLKKRGEKEEEYLKDLREKNAELYNSLKNLHREYIIYMAEQDTKKRQEEEKERQRQLEENKKEAERKAKEKIEAERKAKEESERIRQEEQKEIEKINESIRQKQLTELDKLQEKYEKEKTLFEKYNRDITELTKQYENERREIEIKAAEEAEQARIEYQKRANEAILKLIDEHWAQVSLKNLEAYNNQEISLIEFNSREKAAKIAHLESLLESGKLSAEQELQTQIQLSQEKQQLLEAELDHRRQIVSAIASLSDIAAEIAGKETAAGKALAIAATTISTYQAAQQGYLSAFMPVPTAASPALGALNVAAAIAVGLKNVRQIMQTKVPNAKGGSSAGGGAMGGISTPAPPRVPTAPNIPQSMQPIRNVQTETEIDMSKQPIKAYVVETELRQVQSKSQKTEKEATL